MAEAQQTQMTKDTWLAVNTEEKYRQNPKNQQDFDRPQASKIIRLSAKRMNGNDKELGKRRGGRNMQN